MDAFVGQVDVRGRCVLAALAPFGLTVPDQRNPVCHGVLRLSRVSGGWGKGSKPGFSGARL